MLELELYGGLYHATDLASTIKYYQVWEVLIADEVSTGYSFPKQPEP